MRERWRIALLIAVPLLVYGNTLRNGFAMDDELYIFRNPAVTNLSLSGVFEPTKATNLFRPITFGSLMVNWAVGDGDPFGYHLFNLLLHAIVTLLMYLVLKKLLEHVPRGAIAAWVAAMLFAVHPIHSEAVASIMGRSELLAAGFLLAAWLFHLEDQPVLTVVCFVLALLSKESAIAFVPLVIAGDYACGQWKPLHRYGAIAGIAVVYLALLWKIQGGRFGGKNVTFLDNPLAQIPASLRIPNALRIAWKYVWLQIYPATLSCDYSYNAILLYSKWQRNAPAMIAAICVVALWIWALRNSKREWFLAGAIYLGGFAITANILLPTGTIMGERLAYLPSAGFCLLVALIWMWFVERNRRVAWAVLTLFLLALSARTVARNRDWQDNFSLYSAGVRAVPGSAKMHANLAFQYYYRGQLDLAQQEIQNALRIFPSLPDVVGLKDLIDGTKANDQMARGLLQNELALMRKDSPSYDFIAVNLAGMFVKTGENEQALMLLNQVISRSPGFSRAWSNRAVIWYRQGNLPSARSDAEMALRLDPTNTQAQDVLPLLNSSNPHAPSVRVGP